jgi:hypothetical protein
MVHALAECRRVLTPGGLLIDLRPFAGNWPLDVMTPTQQWTAGTLDDSLEQPDDQAANAAIAAAVRAGWFVPERATTFEFAWYWDTLAELEAYLVERWSTVMRLPPETRRAVQRLLAAGGPEARIRFRRGMRLGCYHRSDGP